MAPTTATPVTTPTTTAAVANELVALCRAGRNEEVLEKFYSPDIVSIESVGNESMPKVMRGIDAIRGKNQWWVENMEVHSANTVGPFLGDDQFAVKFDFDTTFKPTGQRQQMTEMALYTVKNGKIVQEEFFYHQPGV